MLNYIIKRLAALIPVGLGVVILVSLLIHMVPGDPVDRLLGEFATEAERLDLRLKLGLNRPVWEQILFYLKNFFTQGELGNSLIYNKSVVSLILERLPATSELAVLSICIAILISIPLGTLSAVQKDKPFDLIAMTFALLGGSIPNFWLGPMLILLFSVELGWLPVSERSTWQSYVLPACTLGSALAAMLSRMTRNSLLEVLRKDYIRTARAKGLGEWSVVFKHALRNASLPLVTVIGLQFGVLITGTVITEKIFDWPGLGTLMLEALSNRDYPLVQGCVLFFSMSYLIVNFLTDLTYALVDPRIKLDGR